MNEPNIKTLNEILKGEHMAIEGYETVLSTIEDHQLKTRLNGILEDHKRHAMEITNRIYKLGGDPKESTGMVGVMADMKLKLEGMVSRNHVMLHELYQGEKQGIEAVKKTIKGDLDTDSLRLVQEMIETDTRHLGELEAMMK
ncbi:DUF2383 domain-containing protein [Alkaliphilus hydrothermalis]|uniref:Bacterioferritin n=1 Tax=Alkaliphilus hydrothermalis TaxID=1482730 RepID=A0ABS2NPX2_9FIRM|nr:DUF2383 domain-containing protein [Alkaliphilus hydrothermalis]MBM7614988.1 bacterioferritin [Alkaliphilus hydrothermalis]